MMASALAGVTTADLGYTVKPGDRLFLIVRIGDVRIERDVEAVQPARPGQRLFVRTREGQLISVRLEDLEP
jgi:flagella basal body P-ring formation protein FlgA